MEGTGKSLLTIGELAKLCHTTKDALYFYERKGLIKPAFIDDNGYRYYNLQNFYDLDMISSLREAGSSIKEIGDFMTRPTPETYVRHLKEKRDYLRKRQTELALIEARISQSITLTEEGQRLSSSEPVLRTEPAQYLIVKPIEEEIGIRNIISNFSELLIACQKYHVAYDFHMSALLSRDRLLAKNYLADYFYVVSSEPLAGDDVWIKPNGKYLTFLHEGPYMSVEQSYDIMMKYIEEHRLTITGHAYEQTLIGWLNCSDESQYKTLISIGVCQVG